jgi:hypothetical protein
VATHFPKHANMEYWRKERAKTLSIHPLMLLSQIVKMFTMAQKN